METSATEHPGSTAGQPTTSTTPPNGKVEQEVVLAIFANTGF